MYAIHTIVVAKVDESVSSRIFGRIELLSHLLVKRPSLLCSDVCEIRFWISKLSRYSSEEAYSDVCVSVKRKLFSVSFSAARRPDDISLSDESSKRVYGLECCSASQSVRHQLIFVALMCSNRTALQTIFVQLDVKPVNYRISTQNNTTFTAHSLDILRVYKLMLWCASSHCED